MIKKNLYTAQCDITMWEWIETDKHVRLLAKIGYLIKKSYKTKYLIIFYCHNKIAKIDDRSLEAML